MRARAFFLAADGVFFAVVLLRPFSRRWRVGWLLCGGGDCGGGGCGGGGCSGGGGICGSGGSTPRWTEHHLYPLARPRLLLQHKHSAIEMNVEGKGSIGRRVSVVVSVVVSGEWRA